MSWDISQNIFLTDERVAYRFTTNKWRPKMFIFDWTVRVTRSCEKRFMNEFILPQANTRFKLFVFCCVGLLIRLHLPAQHNIQHWKQCDKLYLCALSLSTHNSFDFCDVIGHVTGTRNICCKCVFFVFWRISGLYFMTCFVGVQHKRAASHHTWTWSCVSVWSCDLRRSLTSHTS